MFIQSFTNIIFLYFQLNLSILKLYFSYVEKSIKVKTRTRFGKVLVIDTVSRAGGYVLGFRIDPADLLGTIATEMNNLKNTFARDPVFGIDINIKKRVTFKKYCNFFNILVRR